MTHPDPLRILFATSHPHLPQIAGGLQSSTEATILRLVARGHDARLLAGLTGDGLLGLRHRLRLKLSSRCVMSDRVRGHVTYRAWQPGTDAVAATVTRDFRPQAVVAQGGGVVALIHAFDRQGVPGLIHFRNVEADGLGGRPDSLPPDTAFISNSDFTRGRMKAAFGIDSTVICPVVDAARYRTPTRGAAVLFVNPHPSKGVDIALAMAEACPDIPFVFLEAWTLHGPEHDAMRARAAALPNLRYLPRTEDMRTVYAQAALLIAPSRWEEAFGRVVAEAHVSGIPALATDIGGLPEAVGPGGLLLPASAGAAEWTATLRALWSDPQRRADLSEAARRHAARPELDADWQIIRLEQAVRDRIAAATHPARRNAAV